jgi:hypothetical protein
VGGKTSVDEHQLTAMGTRRRRSTLASLDLAGGELVGAPQSSVALRSQSTAALGQPGGSGGGAAGAAGAGGVTGGLAAAAAAAVAAMASSTDDAAGSSQPRRVRTADMRRRMTMTSGALLNRRGFVSRAEDNTVEGDEVRDVSCRVVSCRVVSCRVVSCRVVSCRVVSCRVVSCRVVSCRVVPCRQCDVMHSV